MVRLLVKGGISVDMNKYKELVDRINIIEKNLLAHEERKRVNKFNRNYKKI